MTDANAIASYDSTPATFEPPLPRETLWRIKYTSVSRLIPSAVHCERCEKGQALTVVIAPVTAFGHRRYLEGIAFPSISSNSLQVQLLRFDF